MTLYLLFNEGYYSNSQNSSLRKDLCFEAIRLTELLLENELMNKPFINALLALMCFQSSRFDARVDQKGESILYQDQDATRWDHNLIAKAEYYLNLASQGTDISKYHLEAGIAYWHCTGTDSREKWENILQLYNHLLVLEYSPIAALNRTYALAKANGKEEAIKEAEKIGLNDSYLYHALLGDLYSDINDQKALGHFQAAFKLVKSGSDQIVLKKRMQLLASRMPASGAQKKAGS
jgi:RNA polymerase sigma-70 factor (ECF subfamily)